MRARSDPPKAAPRRGDGANARCAPGWGTARIVSGDPHPTTHTQTHPINRIPGHPHRSIERYIHSFIHSLFSSLFLTHAHHHHNTSHHHPHTYTYLTPTHPHHTHARSHPPHPPDTTHTPRTSHRPVRTRPACPARTDRAAWTAALLPPCVLRSLPRCSPPRPVRPSRPPPTGPCDRAPLALAVPSPHSPPTKKHNLPAPCATVPR
jgi:hypothetical protein